MPALDLSYTVHPVFPVSSGTLFLGKSGAGRNMQTNSPKMEDRTLGPIRSHRRFSASRSIWALMLREMSTTYGRSIGGYAWVILEPVAGIVLLTLIFSLFLRVPPIGTNFSIFYATGMVPFMFYHAISGKTAQAVQFSKSLLAYPGVTLADALIARAILNGLTGLLAGYIIFMAILGLYETRTNPQILQILTAYAMCFVLATGVGTVNCFLFARFPDWQTMWSVISRPMLILSCVLFMFDNIPHPYDRVLWWNPLVHVIGQMRKGFYLNYPGDYVSPMYVFAVGLGLWALGLGLLVRYHRQIMNEW